MDPLDPIVSPPPQPLPVRALSRVTETHRDGHGSEHQERRRPRRQQDDTPVTTDIEGVEIDVAAEPEAAARRIDLTA